jgi:hypothetical protein
VKCSQQCINDIGCGDFTDIYTNNEFEDMIMKYTPCSADQCTVTITGESNSCATCSIDSSTRLRFLQDTAFQSSAITFKIKSIKPLNEKVVTENLNSNIANANNELRQSGTTFRVASDYKKATLAPTKKPSKKPTPTVRFVFFSIVNT